MTKEEEALETLQVAIDKVVANRSRALVDERDEAVGAARQMSNYAEIVKRDGDKLETELRGTIARLEQELQETRESVPCDVCPKIGCEPATRHLCEHHTREWSEEYETVRRERDEAKRLQNLKSDPVPLILNCPVCHARHIDRGEFAIRSHHTHSCQKCGVTWRPAVVATVGVEFLPGFKDAT